MKVYESSSSMISVLNFLIIFIIINIILGQILKLLKRLKLSCFFCILYCYKRYTLLYNILLFFKKLFII